MKSSTLPDGMPILSRGRHRSPRRGACFMELASLLAGERWSDHPSCTHPLLGRLARMVNDYTSDAGRRQLTADVTAVVGRRGDEQTDVRLAVAVAASTILEVPDRTQRVLAAGLIRAEQLCTESGPELAGIGREARLALDLVPAAVAWAERLDVRSPITAEIFAVRCAPTMVRCAVEGVMATGAPDRDRRLRTLLDVGINACPAPSETPVPAARPARRSRLQSSAAAR